MKILEDAQLEVKRKLPWFIDVLFYPVNISGVVHILIFVVVPLLVSLFINLLRRFIPLDTQFAFGYAMGFIALPFYVMFYSYFFYYITCCVIDSAKGARRAPDISMEDIPDKGDLISRIALLLGCVAICLCPAAVNSVRHGVCCQQSLG